MRFHKFAQIQGFLVIAIFLITAIYSYSHGILAVFAIDFYLTQNQNLESQQQIQLLLAATITTNPCKIPGGMVFTQNNQTNCQWKTQILSGKFDQKKLQKQTA